VNQPECRDIIYVILPKQTDWAQARWRQGPQWRSPKYNWHLSPLLQISSVPQPAQRIMLALQLLPEPP
jgi:hypothetical protein